MDDTGFFSIQVLENALKIYDLKLVRWRSEEMRPFQESPELQPGFILNLEQHWYALRRFGQLGHNFHWFNLNSFETEPKWISTTFLGMTLQQAEQEGYSVFVVKPLDPQGDNAQDTLPCDADNIAVTIPPPSSNPNISNISNLAMQDMGLDLDDDPELQIALQASLQGARETNAFRSAAVEEDDDLPLPDEAFKAFQQSVARQKDSIMQARREQEEALRQIREAEVASGPSRRRTAGDEEEEELLRRALEESQKSTRVDNATGGNPALMMSSTMRNAFGQDRQFPPPSAMPSPIKPRVQPLSSRHYDDEDEDLQAALKASLETAPLNFKVPDPAQLPSRSMSPTKPPANPAPLFNTGSPSKPGKAVAVEEEDDDDEDDEDDEDMVSAPSSPKEEMSMEEIRKMRLARFGGQ
ncbi:hypothetical protein M407DRAFT_32883 [Tulasnella calospora MUT 4182]|uniref:ubiquitinyl hydrolase 1 n=1 Tax=Tulasnella calospora MUT 4182 TaxID=1051891 RepID=A0A0C3L7I4_9AGAM|nr:hypothetical protein M407DRAFT_32883 [Tulasnella calospora MUT 4182]